MSGVKHTPWEVGQHPAVSNGWIVRPILFGSNVRVLPESEGGHVIIRDERIARLVAAAPDHHAVALELDRLALVIDSAIRFADAAFKDEVQALLRDNKAALARARGEQDGGGE